MSSNLKSALIGLIVIAAAIIALLFVIRGRNANAIDTHLATTANRLAPRLAQPGGSWASAPSFAQKYERFVARERIVLQRSKHLMLGQQFVQIQLVPRVGTAPAMVLSSRHGLEVMVNPAVLLVTAATNQPRYATVYQRGTTYQTYLTPLNLPQALRNNHVTAVLEVIQG